MCCIVNQYTNTAHENLINILHYTSLHNPTLPQSKSNEPNAVAVFSFEGAASDELRFNEGDNIILLDRVGDQWLKGQCKGSTGIFPANHVKVIVSALFRE